MMYRLRRSIATCRRAGEGPERMTVRYSPKVARWIAEREGKSVAADESLTMEHPLADPAWGVRHVLQYGAEAEVVGPGWMRERVVARLHAMSTADGTHMIS